MRLKNNLINKYKIILFIFLNYLLYQNNIIIYRQERKVRNRIGIVGQRSGTNIGNNLVKYSIYILLKSFGFKPVIIVKKSKKNIYFLKKYIDIEEITDFNQLKEYNYDLLMVNSDQTWNYKMKNFLDIGFLAFSKNWNIPKFVYGASIGNNNWNPSKETLNTAKHLLQKFSDVSVREYGSIDLIHKKLGIKPKIVLDPTFLLDKSIYLNLINNFEMNLDSNENYFCTYILDKKEIILNFVQEASSYLHYKILDIRRDVDEYIEKFIYSINICKSILTDSFHGTVFSIIFGKPFITFINSKRGSDRFFTLNKIFNLNERIVFPKVFEKSDANLLKINPVINKAKFIKLRIQSIKYLKKNLGMI